MAQFAPQQTAQNIIAGTSARHVTGSTVALSGHGSTVPARGQRASAAGLPLCLCHLLRASRLASQQAWSSAVSELHLPCSWSSAARACRATGVRMRAIPQRSVEFGSLSMDQDSLPGGPPLAALALPSQPAALRVSATSAAVLARPASSVLTPNESRVGGVDGKSSSTGAVRRELGGDAGQGTNPGNGDAALSNCGEIVNHPLESRRRRGELLAQQRPSVEMLEQHEQRQQQSQGNQGEALTEALLPVLSHRSQAPGPSFERGNESDSRPSLPTARNGRLSPQSAAAVGKRQANGQLRSAPAPGTRLDDRGNDGGCSSSSIYAGMLNIIDGGPDSTFTSATSATATVSGVALPRGRPHQQQRRDQSGGSGDDQSGRGTAEASAPLNAWSVRRGGGRGGGGLAGPSWPLTQAVRVELGPDAAFSLVPAQATGIAGGAAAAVTAEGPDWARGRAAAPDPWLVRGGTSGTSTSSGHRAGFSGVSVGASAAAAAVGRPRAAVGLSSPQQRQKAGARARAAAGAARKAPKETATTAMGRAKEDAALALLSPPPRPHALRPAPAAAAQPAGTLALVRPAALAMTAAPAGQESGSALLPHRADPQPQQQRVLMAAVPGALGFGGDGGREVGSSGSSCQPVTAAGMAPHARGGSVSPLGNASSLTEGATETRRQRPQQEQQRQHRRCMPYDRSPQGQGEQPRPSSTGRRSWPGVSNSTAVGDSTAAGAPDLGQPLHQPSATSPVFPGRSNGLPDRPGAAPLLPLIDPRLVQPEDERAGGSDGVAASSEPVWDADSDFNDLDRIGEPSTSYDATALPLEPQAGWRRHRRLVHLFPVPRPHRRKRRALERAARAAAKAATASAEGAGTGTGTGGALMPPSSRAPVVGQADGEADGDVSGSEYGAPSAATPLAAAPPNGSRRQRFIFPFTVSRTSDTAIQMLALAPRPGLEACPGSSTGERGQPPSVLLAGGLRDTRDVGEPLGGGTKVAADGTTTTVPGGSREGYATVAEAPRLRAGLVVSGRGAEDTDNPGQNASAPPLPSPAAVASRAGAALAGGTAAFVGPSEASGAPWASWDDLTADAALSPAGVLPGARAALGAAAQAAVAAAPVQASEPYLQLFTQSYVLYGIEAPEHRYLVYRYGSAGGWSWRPMLRVTGTRSPPLVAVAIPAVPAATVAAAAAASTSSPDHLPDRLTPPPRPQLQGQTVPSSVDPGASGCLSGAAVQGVPEDGACSQLATSAAAAAGPTSLYGDGAGDPASTFKSVDAGGVAPLQFYLTAEAPQPPTARTPPPLSAKGTAARADGAREGVAAVAASAAAGLKYGGGGGGGAGTDGGGSRPPSAGCDERSRPASTRAAQSTAPPPAPAAFTAAAAPYDGVAPLELSRPGHYLVGAHPIRPDGCTTGSGRRSSSRVLGGSSSSGDGSGGGGSSSKAGSRAPAAGRGGAPRGQKAPEALLAKAMEMRRRGTIAAAASTPPALVPVVPYDAAAAVAAAASGPLGPTLGSQQPPHKAQAGPVAPSAGRQQQCQQGQQQQQTQRRQLQRLHPAVGEVPGGGRELRSGPSALRGQPWAQPILRQDLALVMDASSLAGWRDRHWDQSALALRRLWEGSKTVRPGLLVLATSRLLKSLQQLWADKQACLPQPDVLLLGQGTQVAYRLAPPSLAPGGGGTAAGRGAELQDGGGWQQDEEWAAALDQSYDAAAVRQAVADVVRECSSLRVVGGGSRPRGPAAPAQAAATGTVSTSAAADDPAEEEEDRQNDDVADEGDASGLALPYTAAGRPAVSYGLAKQQGRHQVCLLVHRSLLDLVTRRIEDRLRELQPQPRPQTGVTDQGPSPSAAATATAAAAAAVPGGPCSSAAAACSPAGPHTSARSRDRSSSSTASQAVGTSAGLRDRTPAHPCSSSSSPPATLGPRGDTSPGRCPPFIRFVSQPRGPRGEWTSLYVLPAAAGKAAALRHVLSRFGIDPRVVVAVGDTDRDAELLAAAAAAVVTAPRPPPALRQLLLRGRTGRREGSQTGDWGEDGSLRASQSLGSPAVDAWTEAGGGGGGVRLVAVQSSVSGPAGAAEGLQMLGLL